MTALNLYSIIPMNNTPTDMELRLRAILQEGYGGVAAADVQFLSNQRSIVIQTTALEWLVFI